MSGHTPGPWTAHFDEDYFVRGPDGGRVAMMQHLKGLHGLGGRRTCEESAANCRLIAASPDLLAALEMTLQELIDAGYDGSPLGLMLPSLGVAAARAAIAKVKGKK